MHGALSFIVLLFALTGLARADGIALAIDRIGAGSYVVYSDGSRSFTNVYRGQTGPHWVVDLVEGADPNGPQISREYRDWLGQVVRIDYANGAVFRFNPHDCQRTPGPCIFTQTSPDGTTQQGRITTPTRNGYSYELKIIPDRGDAVLVSSGVMVLDAMGGFARGTITAQDGTVTVVRQVQAVYR